MLKEIFKNKMKFRLPSPVTVSPPSPVNIIPIVLLVVFGALSLRSPLWTVISFLSLVLSLHIIYKKIRKKGSNFYFSFTLTSLIGAHLVYELIGTPFMRITYWEYTINIFLFTLTLYLIYKTKISIWKENESSQSDLYRNFDSLSEERRKLAMAQKHIPSYNYCRRCHIVIPGRDHHCVWLNVCIGKANRYWFLGCLTVGACWIALIANIFLNSICYPVSIFSTGLFGSNDGPITWTHHYGLIPVSCPEAYVKTSITIGFVTSVYGLCVLLFIIAVLVHQLRLLIKGVSYLELKHSSLAKPVRNIPTVNIPAYNSDSSTSSS